MATDYRIAVGLVRSERSRRHFPTPKPSNAAAKLGLAYERKVGKELAFHVTRGNFYKLEHNPWFTFYDIHGIGNCSPDYLLYLENGIVVVEIKLRWVDNALAKLEELYCPVVSNALGYPTRPLVICRYLSPSSPPAQVTLRHALRDQHKLMLWPANGHILW